MKKVNIQTAQHVDVHYKAASVGERIVAAMLDYIIIIFYFIGIIYISFFLYENFFDKHFFYFLILQLPVIFYDLFFEILLNGQSPGKKIMKIRVVKLDGTQPTIGSYLLRWIFRFIDIALSGGTVAVSVILINGKGQRVGDIAAGTTVVSLKSEAGLKDTILMDIEADYVPVYTHADRLDNETVSVIKDVLNYYYGHKKNSVAQKALDKMKAVVEKKLNISSHGSSVEFLETILKDYNYLNGTVV